MRYVIDTSALFSMEDLPQGDLFVTPGVIRELEKYKDRRLVYWEEMLKVSEPSMASLLEIKKAAISTGDDARLSPVDISILALAKELGAVLLSDDYSIQNVARYLSIPFKGVGMKEIKEVIKWSYRCTGCGKYWDKNMDECPICGSPLKSKRSRE